MSHFYSFSHFILYNHFSKETWKDCNEKFSQMLSFGKRYNDENISLPCRCISGLERKTNVHTDVRKHFRNMFRGRWLIILFLKLHGACIFTVTPGRWIERLTNKSYLISTMLWIYSHINSKWQQTFSWSKKFNSSIFQTQVGIIFLNR